LFTAYLIQELADFVPNFKSNYSKHNIDLQRSVLLLKPFGANVPGLVSGVIPMFKMAKGFKPFMTENQLALLTVAQQEITRNYSSIIRWDIICLFWYT
jgi:hypothetical protein